MAISSIDAAAYIAQFKDAAKDLAGGPERSYLKQTFGFEKCEGRVSFIKGAFQANLGDGAATAMSARTNRYTFDASASTSAAAFAAAVLTRNDTTTFQRTQIQAMEIDVGKWSDIADKEFLALSDLTSRELRNLMQQYFTKQDMRCINALFAATQTRVVGNAATESTTSSVAMPASQVLPDVSLASIDYKIFSAIKKRFMKQFVSGKTIYACFGPDTWEALVNNSGDKLLNKDYVDSAAHFMGGDLPKVFGVVPMVHPLFENSTVLGDLLANGENGLISAWTEDGVCWGEYKGMETSMDINMPAMKNQSVARVFEFANACRNDNLQVVTGAVLAQ